MLQSMTGQGDATLPRDGMVVSVEVRAINGRYFKLSYRGSEGCGALESRVDAVIRQAIRRGTVQVEVKVARKSAADPYRLNTEVLAGYYRQLETLFHQFHPNSTPALESLLALPGVVEENQASEGVDEIWPLVEETLHAALANLAQMRADEGRAMATDLAHNCRTIGVELTAIEARAPEVVQAYRGRLVERMNAFLQQHDLRLEASDLLREVAVFAERCDISEEVVRLRSHLEQFDTILQQEESAGRKLEFLTQEMFRETNTIGSKANDAEVARHVIEIKAAIERMREMIQNVE
ncbi:YicC/YloC family endoribonuclease [Lignipirellula cremea]|uniref:YicC family protein n=1 Tax=Lignipirellula cremea TaxID=2528010 RepID=A0A518DQX2_9BACT|nr:YicC/YloC family endoribonuclease [Lignipirellula cremea]QDU94240.1 Conserved hypothetical protein CHP00255 [Lignipirellula cremea]